LGQVVNGPANSPLATPDGSVLGKLSKTLHLHRKPSPADWNPVE